MQEAAAETMDVDDDISSDSAEMLILCFNQRQTHSLRLHLQLQPWHRHRLINNTCLASNAWQTPMHVP